MEKYDLAIIGSGPGGYIAAIRAAQLGMNVAIIERDKPGGVCLNWGCIPSKAILKCAEIYEYCKKSDSFGVNIKGLSYDYSKVIERSRGVSSTLTKGVEFLYKKNKVKSYQGTGKLITNNKIGIKNDKQEIEIEAKNILIATGSVPKTVPGIEIDGKFVMTSDEAIMSSDFPDSIVIIGGGYIGAEFAYVYNTFGSKVTIVEMENHLLPGTDSEVAKELEKTFKKAGITVLTNTKYNTCRILKTKVKVTVENTSSNLLSSINASKLLIAVGRNAVANTAPTSLSYYKKSDDLGLRDLKIELNDQGFIKTDDSFRTTCTNVLAIGDVIGPPLLAHKASEEGVIAAEIMFGINSTKVHYDRIPSCVYCQPEIASIGITEDKAEEEGINVEIGKFPFRANGKAIASGNTEGFVKIISDSKSGEILGTHIIGHGATELIAEIGVAKTLESTPLEIALTPHAHPTLSEALMEAALNALGRARNI